jgi:oligopeptide transport system substrate-binding protein
MLRLLIIPTVLLALLAGAMVWSGGITGGKADFTFVCPAENKTLDLDVMSWMQDIRIAYALYEGLYTLDPATLEPILGCADKVDVGDDRIVYTFHIRTNARWTNGDDLKSSDFVFAWRRMIEQPGEYTYLFDYIRGAHAYGEAYVNWKADVGKWAAARKPGDGSHAPPKPAFDVGVAAVSDKILKVTLSQPVPYFPALCSYVPFYPQHEGCMQAFAQWNDDTKTYIASYDQRFTRPPNLVSNGPYRLAEWSFKRRVRLIASDGYWNRQNVKSRVIDQIYANDPLAAYRIYQSGEAGWLTDAGSELVPELRKAHRTDLKLFPAFGTYYYDFNCSPTLPGGKKNPLADRRVRRALGMAIFKQPIVDNGTRAGEVVARTYVPVGVFPGYPSPPGLSYDPAEARRLLADAGYEGGAGFPRLSILFSSESPAMNNVAEIVRRQWQQELGIDVDLESMEVTVRGARLHSHDFSIAAGDWYGDYDDISTFTDLFKSTSENNNSNWKSADYDDLLAKAAFEGNPKLRFDLLARAENLMLEDAPIVPLYYGVGQYLIHDNVHGIPINARQSVMLQAVSVDRP